MAESYLNVGANLAGRVGSTKGVKFASVAPITDAISDEIDYQREKAEKEAERRRDLQDKMYELHGEDIFNNFESTGFENPDILGRSISNKTKQIFTGLNKQYSDGKISRSDYMGKVYKVVGQVKKAAGDFAKIKEYADSINESGEDLSQTTLANAERVKAYFDGVGFDMDEDYNMVFFGTETDEEGNKVQIETPFDKLGSLLEVRQGYDFSEVSNAIFDVDKEASKFFERGTVFKRWMDNGGEFSEEQKNFIDKYTRSTLYDDEFDLYDAGKRVGLTSKELERDARGNIKNKDLVYGKVKDYIYEKVKDDYILRASSDQVEGQKLLNEMDRIKIAKEKPTKQTKDQSVYNRLYEVIAKGRNGGEAEVNTMLSTIRSIEGVKNARFDAANNQLILEREADTKGNIKYQYLPLSGDGREDNIISVGGILGDPDMAAKGADIFDKSNSDFSYDYTNEDSIGELSKLKSPMTKMSNGQTPYERLEDATDEDAAMRLQEILLDLYGINASGIETKTVVEEGFFGGGQDQIKVTTKDGREFLYQNEDAESMNKAILDLANHYREISASTRSNGRYSGFNN